MAQKMRRGSVEREQIPYRTPYNAQNRALSTFGVCSRKEDRLERPRGLERRYRVRAETGLTCGSPDEARASCPFFGIGGCGSEPSVL